MYTDTLRLFGFSDVNCSDVIRFVSAAVKSTNSAAADKRIANSNRRCALVGAHRRSFVVLSCDADGIVRGGFPRVAGFHFVVVAFSITGDGEIQFIILFCLRAVRISRTGDIRDIHEFQ